MVTLLRVIYVIGTVKTFLQWRSQSFYANKCVVYFKVETSKNFFHHKPARF